MRRLHFEALRPTCPICGRIGHRARLELEPGAACATEDVRTGVLRCTAADCMQRFPIIEGVPLLVLDLAGWLSANLHLVLASDIDGAAAEAVVAAAVGPEAAFNLARQQQSSYGHDHYGDVFEPTATEGPDAAFGGVRRCQASALGRLSPIAGPALDIGCAVGRTTFDLAAACDGPVLGIDLNWPLLRIGRRVLDHGLLRYPLRRLGNRYDRRESRISLPGAERVDFWIADALALPFADDVFRLVVALNVLDCVADPVQLVAEAGRVAAPGAGVALATPLDWAVHATPASAWLDTPERFEAMVAEVSHVRPGAKPLVPTAEAIEMAWTVRIHDRAAIAYRTRLTTLRASPPDNAR